MCFIVNFYEAWKLQSSLSFVEDQDVHMHKEKKGNFSCFDADMFLFLVLSGRIEPPLEDAWRLAKKVERIIDLLDLSQDVLQAFKTQANALDIPEGEHSGHKYALTWFGPLKLSVSKTTEACRTS